MWRDISSRIEDFKMDLSDNDVIEGNLGFKIMAPNPVYDTNKNVIFGSKLGRISLEKIKL